jgi:hypothetical protein
MIDRKQIATKGFHTEGHNYSVLANIMHRFWQECSADEVISTRMQMDTKMSETELFSRVKRIMVDIFGRAGGNFVSSKEFVVQSGYQALINVKNGTYRPSTNGIYEYEFELYGSQTDTMKLADALELALRDHKMVKISWYYSTSRGTDSASLHVTGLNQHIRDQFYPWFRGGVNQFIQSYFDNPASVLVLYGPPGTGKTSFLRHLLLTQGVNAMVTYDDKVLAKDEFFVNYLTDDEHNVLIVEDADVFLSPRDNGENTMMSKFLNVSDGLIKVTNKKMIFTTNITQLNKIDSALLRPGRCFSAVEFRELTPSEAQVAAEAADQPSQDWNSQAAWTLAQVFNCAEPSLAAPKFKVGFGG